MNAIGSKCLPSFAVLALGLWFSVAGICSAGDANIRVEGVARALANEYRATGWTYKKNGPNLKNESNCSEFVVEVFRRLGLPERFKKDSGLKGNFTQFSSRAAINTDVGPGGLTQAIKDERDAIRGPQYALTAANAGIKVEPAGARTGDFIQYWKGQAGHTGVLVNPKVVGNTLTFNLIGMHEGNNAEKLAGAGIISLSLNLADSNIKVFIGRYQE